ncbi:hypothetical protein [Kingella potus]|nr:hypothetical protein [Kingella potus]
MPCWRFTRPSENGFFLRHTALQTHRPAQAETSSHPARHKNESKT